MIAVGEVDGSDYSSNQVRAEAPNDLHFRTKNSRCELTDMQFTDLQPTLFSPEQMGKTYFFLVLFWRRDCFCIFRLALALALAEPELKLLVSVSEALTNSEKLFRDFRLTC